MRVIDHEPQAWFLYEDGARYVLGVNCTSSNRMVDYELLVELTAEESQAYLARGRVSVDDLARRIARSPEEAWPRRRDDLAPSTDAAFDMWKRSQPAG